MNRQRGWTLVELLTVIIILAGAIGYVLNIVRLVAMTIDPFTTLLVVRVVGIVMPPLGAIIGYIPN